MSSARWPENLVHERIVGLYEKNAAAWDRQRGRELFEKPWLDDLLARLPERPSVLDLGCGTGEPIGRYFIERGAELTGVDSSLSMIALCRERFPEQQWLVADMRRLDLGRAFDAVVAWHSFFHLSPEDQAPMFQRFAAHTRPGGHLLFTSGHERGVSMGSWQGEPLYHSSLDPEEYRTLLAANGFNLVRHWWRDPECGDATIWLARARGSGAEAGRRRGAGG